MKRLKIKKKSGGDRFVISPNHAEKARLRLQVEKLNNMVIKKCDKRIVHGFVPGKNPVTNALEHRGFQYTLNMDLKDFFDTVLEENFRLKGKLKNKHLTQTQMEICFYQGAARQGLPTSPAISNLAMIDMDKFLKGICKLKKIVYTRYADDLSFSGNNIIDLKRLRDRLPKISQKYGFEINPKKTRIQSARFGRRNITGVMVDDNIHPSRAIKRRLRAAKHKNKKHQVRGFDEWMKLPLPNPKGTKRISKVKKTQIRHVARKLQGLDDVWVQ